jgi:ferritin-like metal-binding protein YciE
MSNFRESFLEELADIHHAEKQLIKALPKMAKAASSTDLKDAFQEHLKQTEEQVARLEEVFESFDEKPKTKPCEAMEGLIEEGEEIIKENDSSATRDALLIAAAQKVEHYEISTYGTLSAWAELLDNEKAVNLLKENLGEEDDADEKLNELSEKINREALDEDESDEQVSSTKSGSQKVKHSMKKLGKRPVIKFKS